MTDPKPLNRPDTARRLRALMDAQDWTIDDLARRLCSTTKAVKTVLSGEGCAYMTIIADRLLEEVENDPR